MSKNLWQRLARRDGTTVERVVDVLGALSAITLLVAYAANGGHL